MRILFAGTPAVAVPVLHALHESEHDVAAVLTRPPAPFGRRRTLTPSHVHQAAESLGIPVLTGDPDSPEVLEQLRGVDVVAVVAYGRLIREPALSVPQHGWINLHYSLLPRWRGAAPVQHAIMAGDSQTGVSVFQIEQGLDTGPVFAMETEPILPTDTAAELLTRLTDLGAPVMVRTLDAIAAGTATARPQAGDITLAPTLHSEDGRVRWDAPAEEVGNRIRGLTPAPGAWTGGDSGRFKLAPVTMSDAPALPPGRVVVTRGGVLVGTGSSPVGLTRIAPPGKQWMDAADWARGLRDENFTFEGDR